MTGTALVMPERAKRPFRPSPLKSFLSVYWPAAYEAGIPSSRVETLATFWHGISEPSQRQLAPFKLSRENVLEF